MPDAPIPPHVNGGGILLLSGQSLHLEFERERLVDSSEFICVFAFEWASRRYCTGVAITRIPSPLVTKL